MTTKQEIMADLAKTLNAAMAEAMQTAKQKPPEKPTIIGDLIKQLDGREPTAAKETGTVDELKSFVRHVLPFDVPERPGGGFAQFILEGFRELE